MSVLYYFAPLEGITDGIYRELHFRHFGGVSKYFMPFISPGPQMRLSNRDLRGVEASRAEGLVCVPQLLTRDAHSFIACAEWLAALGYKEVNLNLGCPSGTVTAKGKGSALLKDPSALYPFFDELCARSPLPISIKTRIGFDDYANWEKLCRVFSSYPFCEVIIHPRLRSEFYRGAVHKDAYAAYYALHPGLAVYNGDLFSAEDIALIAQQFPLTHAVMLGRGLVAAPYLAGGSFDIGRVKRFHAALIEAYAADRPANAALGHMLEIMRYMSACYENSRRYLKQMQKARSLEEYLSSAETMFDCCAPKTPPCYFPIKFSG